MFARRADRNIAAPAGASWRRAVEALAPNGSVLDVGAGTGAASLPLAPHATQLTAVDSSSSMMDDLVERAKRLGLPVRTVIGRWPDVADTVDPADVVVCHNVFYNVPDLDAFAAALTAHAHRRVVVELTEVHPLVPLNPLWRLLHDLDRPAGPSAADAVAVLREVGIDARAERGGRPPRSEYASFDALVAVTRRRLCLPPERDDELARALLDLGVDREHPRDLGAPADDLVTLWWDTAK